MESNSLAGLLTHLAYHPGSCFDCGHWQEEDGPGVPYTVHLSSVGGFLLHMAEPEDFNPMVEDGPFGSFHLELRDVAEVFGDVWNKYYEDGYHELLWSNQAPYMTMRMGQQVGHQVYYGEVGRACMRTRRGVLEDGGDFFKLLERGKRWRKRRVYTYTLLDEGLFFSETGMAGVEDMASKHVLHSGVAQQVRFAGTFRIIEDPTASSRDLQQRCALFIDNDSGTYRPNPDHLALLKEVFEINFPGMQVWAVNCTAPQPEETKDWMGPVEVEDSPDRVYVGTGKYIFTGDED